MSCELAAYNETNRLKSVGMLTWRYSPKPYFVRACLATGLVMKAANATAVGLAPARFSTT
jgi:hypothetical protein